MKSRKPLHRREALSACLRGAEASHRLLMTPQPDPIDAPPPPGPPYRRGHEPMFNLPPGTLWLALAMVAMLGLQTLLEGPSWSWLLKDRKSTRLNSSH